MNIVDLQYSTYLHVCTCIYLDSCANTKYLLYEYSSQNRPARATCGCAYQAQLGDVLHVWLMPSGTCYAVTPVFLAAVTPAHSIRISALNV